MKEECVARHLLIEIAGSTYLNDAILMEEFLKSLGTLFGGPIQGLKVYQFHPFGLSALMIMPDSHIAIHTWPENEFASIDIFLQAQYDPNESLPLIQRYFHPDEVKIIELERGIKKGDGTLVLRGLHH